MTENVKPIRGDRMPFTVGKPNPDLVKAMERLLAQAKSGEMQCIAVVMLMSDGTCNHGMLPGAPSGEIARLVGAMEECKLILMMGALGMGAYQGVDKP